MDQINKEVNADVNVPEQQAAANKFCASCGSELAEGTVFCAKCGASVKGDTASDAPAGVSLPNPAPARQYKFHAGMIFDAVGALAGVLSLIFSIVVYSSYAGSWESGYSYGGDAYTGIQNAAAQTANNVQALAELVRFGMGSVLLVAGLVLCCCFGAKLYRGLTGKEKTDIVYNSRYC